ncbi:MAG: thiamine-phosphate kinase [Chloroflexi bacterium]|nr:thiamine-phosphate kinase [Chloroflexota bacterium]|tara:strand:+ start:1847 stop:2860 length:1014 start_codon:yes stop_codon:yes gene_type:complete
MNISNYGEFNIIQSLMKVVEKDNLQIINNLGKLGYVLSVPAGDDSAVWNTPYNSNIVSVDALVENVHFNLNYISWEQLGSKSVSVNLSDIAAMGARPIFITINLGINNNINIEDLTSLYIGIMKVCKIYNVAIIGGDIVKSRDFFISISAYGSSINSKNLVLKRSGALVNDLIAVTGNLGSSYAGYKLLSENIKIHDEFVTNHLIDAHNNPIPRVNEGIKLLNLGANSAIDISDGLLDDLNKLCKVSKVGAEIYSNDLPIHSYLKKAFSVDYLDYALNGGEDYELLFTASDKEMKKIINQKDLNITIIGKIIKDGLVVLDNLGNKLDIKIKGWDHFK